MECRPFDKRDEYEIRRDPCEENTYFHQSFAPFYALWCMVIAVSYNFQFRDVFGIGPRPGFSQNQASVYNPYTDGMAQ